MKLSTLRGRTRSGRNRSRRDAGFTLVELLVVITILGILAAVVIAAVSGIGDKGEAAAVKTDTTIQQTAQEAFCAKTGTLEDPSILQREGFLSSASGYTDVAIDRSAPTENCDGSTFEVFVPKKTDYPVTVTGCAGTRTTFTEKPARPFAIEPTMHELFVMLGIDDNLQAASPMPTALLPADVRDRTTANLARNPVGAPDYTSGSPSGFYPTQAYLLSRNPDFISFPTINSVSLSTSGLDRYSGYTEQDLIGTFPDDVNPSAAGDQPLATYVSFGYGGCTKVLDAKSDGTALARTSLEGTFADLRNLGIVFDVQERAAEVISAMRSSIAESLDKAGPGKDMVVAVGSHSGFSGTQLYGGNHAANGLINLAGGRNAFGDVRPPSGRQTTTTAEVLRANPQILILPTLTLDAQGRPDCAGQLNTWRTNAVLNDVSAVVNDRMLCVYSDRIVANGYGSVETIAALADELAKGPGAVGPNPIAPTP